MKKINLKKYFKKIKKININKKVLFSSLIIIYLSIFLFNTLKPIPKNLNYESKTYQIPQNNIEFLYDLTYIDNNNTKIIRQEIFENIFQMIENSNNYILLDMFLFNPHLGKSTSSYLELSSLLTDKLIEKKKENNNIKIDFVTDEINTIYGGSKSLEIEKLKNNNINVQFTNLNKLKDSNPIYSSFWRMFFIWFKNNDKGGILKHPFNPEIKVSIRSYLKMLNFKANHRKTIIADNNKNEFTSIITSANPHDASSAHSNVAIKIKGDFAKEIYTTEIAASNNNLEKINFQETTYTRSLEKYLLNTTLITEKKIRDNILEEIEKLEKGDEINIAMFYLSDRKIIKSLLKASEKGIEIKLILDPNKDAFGYEKNGIPNRQVAYELIKKSNGKIKIKWYNTSGEQFHTKLIHIKKKDGTSILILGSANLTKRNIGNYNLEMNIKIKGNTDIRFFKKIEDYYNTIWENKNNNKYTLEYEKYKDESKLKYIFYRFQEFTGLSTY